MPFDGSDFHPKRPGRNGGTSGDNMTSFLIIMLAVGLLVMPISLAAIGDIVRYLQGS